MAFLDENGVAQLWAAVKDRLSGAFGKVEFNVAEAASNLVSGDSIPTAFGKLAKNYSSILTSISDLNTNLTNQINAKLNKSDVLANYTTTATGKALDASLGPAIKSKMDLADNLNNSVGAILINTGSNRPVNYKTFTQYASVTIPANTGPWLVVGYVTTGEGDEILHTAHIISTPSVNVHFYSGKTKAGSGGGAFGFGYVEPHSASRVVAVEDYGYTDTTRSNGGGTIFAIRLK